MSNRAFDSILVPCLLGLILASTAGAQTIWYVDAANCPGPGSGTLEDPFCRIQEAINAAAPSATPPDEIHVANGIYTGGENKDLDFGGRIIKLRSVNGPGTCIIDCEGSGRGFYFHSGETAEALVEGLTIRNGHVTLGSPGSSETGGGVFCRDSSPTLANCVITANTVTGQSYGYGGGVCSVFGSITLIGCTISGNSATATGPTSIAGAGVYCEGGVLTACTISGNRAFGSTFVSGGGVWCMNSTLSNCTIDGNRVSTTGSANVYGGGVYCSGSTLSNCRINGNTAAAAGSANARGGGVLCLANTLLTNCLINGNIATAIGSSNSYGGGLYSSDDTSLTNCTLIGNSAASSGGAVFFSDSSSTFRVTNSILWGNTPQEICVTSGTAVVSYCDVQGGYPGTGNIDADPGFAFLDDPYLMPGSPCLDAGTDAPTGGLPPTDFDGNARSLDANGDGSALPDMGAYEFNPAAPALAVSPARTVVYIPEGQADPVVRTLSIRNAGGGTLHWVLAWDGSWLQADPMAGESTGEVDTTILTVAVGTLPHGTYSTLLTAADPQASNHLRTVEVVLHVTNTLDVPGDYATIQAAIDAATVPGDEVVVADGTYTGAGNKDLDFHGRAITVRSAGGNPAKCIIDCEGTGRGFYFHSGETAAAVVTGFTIRNGRVGTTSPGGARGGGVFCSGSGPTLTNCTLSSNAAVGSSSAYGGGVYCSDAPRLSLTNCIIIANSASSGGAIASFYSGLALTNCTISGNSASLGGGVFCGAPSLTITNSILWSNTPPQIAFGTGTLVTVTYSNVQGGYLGTGNINVDPGFAFADDLHLAPGSPCIDAGTNSPPAGLPSHDLDGSARPLDGNADGQSVADIGAYEFRPDTPTIALTPQRFVLSIPQGSPAPDSKTLSIRDAGGGVLSWSVNSDASWLQPDPAQGDSSGEIDTVTLTADATALTHGNYSTMVTVADPQASNNPRVVEVVLHVPTLLYVPSEFATMQAAIDAAVVPGDQVVVADGTYTGPGNKDLDFHGRTISLRSASGDPAACIIDCQGSGRGFYFHSRETAATAVEGFTIRNGAVDSSSLGGANGAGLFFSGSSPTISNCIIRGNTTSWGTSAHGGGVYCTDSSSPTLAGCTIRGNTSYYGGGVYGSVSSAMLIHCTITDNTGWFGGGVSFWVSGTASPGLIDCMVSGNTAGFGAGVWCYAFSPTLTDCTISSNVATGSESSHGGGVTCVYNSHATLANCTISGNTASGSYGGAGGVSCASSIPALTNCILWGDLPREISWSSSMPVVTYCDVQGGFSGTGNINLDPLFVDPDGQDNNPATWQDNDYRLSTGSPCIDSGKNAAVPPDTADLDSDGDTTEPTPLDLDGYPRFVNDPATPDCPYAPGTCGTAPIVDMGAYEFQPLFLPGDLNCDALVNTDDIPPFVLALTDPAAYQAAYPGCDPNRVDLNASGTADGDDIQAFVDLLLLP